MKILFVIKSSTLYGSNMALLNLIDGLKEKIEPLVVYSTEGPFIDQLKEKKIPIAKLGRYSYQIYPSHKTFKGIITYLPRLFYLAYNHFVVNRLVRIAKRFKADLIHTNVGPVHIGYSAAERLNIPHIWHVREFQGSSSIMEPFPSLNLYKNKLRKSNVVFISQVLSDYFEGGDNSRVIYDGVLKSDQTRFLSIKEKYFLFVGRIEVGKGIQDLLQAFLQFSLQNKEYKLYIVGDGEDSKYMVQFIKENNLENRVLLLGFRKDRFDLMASATATIVPSLSEGFGLTTVEAIYNGCLVIGRDNTGTGEILSRDDLNVKFSSIQELKDAMLEIADNGIEHYYLRILEAQKNASQFYSIEQNSAYLYEYYVDLLNK